MKRLISGLLVAALSLLVTSQLSEAKTLDEKLKERLIEAERLGREADKGFRLTYYNQFVTTVRIVRGEAERLIACDDTKENRDFLAMLPAIDTEAESYDDIPEEYQLNGPSGEHDFFWKTKFTLNGQVRDFYLINKLQTCEKKRKADGE